MKVFIIVFLAFASAIACSMGQRSKRLTAEVDGLKLHWYGCTEKMIGPDYKGKLCLVQCELELQKDGTCKKDKYKYISKDYKENHEYFQNHVMTPADQVF